MEGNNNIAIAAHELGARTRRAWIYRGVNVNVLEGQVGAITGPAGSGRTSLLLALAARMPFTTGSLRVCGHGLPEGASSVRSAVAVARAGGANDLEPELRVRDHLIERGVRGDREALFDKACGRLGLTVDRYALAGDLAAGPAALLCLALALLDEPRIVLLDDLDRGLPGAEQSELWQRMRALTEDGVTVLATSTDSTPAHGWADILIDLTGVAS